jgi:hypothetical protein
MTPSATVASPQNPGRERRARLLLRASPMEGTRGMDDWWGDLEREILESLEGHGPVAPAQIGRRLGISEDAAASLLSLLAQEGKVRIRLVDLP